MSMLQAFFETDEFKDYISENDDILEAAQDAYLEFSVSLKSYMMENVGMFIVPHDLAATRANMVEFVESGCETFLQELRLMMRGEMPEEDLII